MFTYVGLIQLTELGREHVEKVPEHIARFREVVEKEGGKVECEPAVMFWGGYYCSLIDRYGNEWMMNCMAK